MNNKVLVLCDTEEEYAHLMTEFIKKYKDILWEIHTYTDIESLLDFIRYVSVEMLVIAENAYTEQITDIEEKRIILLNESGVVKWNHLKNINKYQPADNVFREILQQYADIVEIPFPRLGHGSKTKLIGMYSPVRRCLQTSFALTLGQMLAEKHKTLYLNLEHYAGISELVPDMQSRDLADVIFFLTGDKKKFLIRIQTIIQKKGALDYIPPIRIGQNLLTVTLEEWKNLLDRILEWGEYEYVILDLSENIQGLFQILRMCFKIFTLTKTDEAAKSKIIQYEQVLALYQYEDILDKTFKYNLPIFRRLPNQIEQFTKGELADYIRSIIKEEFC